MFNPLQLAVRVYTDYVEAYGGVTPATVGGDKRLRRGDYALLLAPRDGFHGPAEVGARSVTYLNDHQHVMLAQNKIQFAKPVVVVTCYQCEAVSFCRSKNRVFGNTAAPLTLGFQRPSGGGLQGL